MKRIDLTADQEAIAFSELEIARIRAKQGNPGMVLGQIALTNGGDVVCDFGFIEGDKANRIMAIQKEKPQ